MNNTPYQKRKFFLPDNCQGARRSHSSLLAKRNAQKPTTTNNHMADNVHPLPPRLLPRARTASITNSTSSTSSSSSTTTTTDICCAQLSQTMAKLTVNIDGVDPALLPQLKNLVGKTGAAHKTIWIYNLAKYTGDVEDNMQRRLDDEEEGDRRPMTTTGLIEWCKATMGKKSEEGKVLIENPFMDWLYLLAATCLIYDQGFYWLETDMDTLQERIDELEEKDSVLSNNRAGELSEIHDGIESIKDDFEFNSAEAQEVYDALKDGDLEEVRNLLENGTFLLDIGTDPLAKKEKKEKAKRARTE